jgi:hypothetical protein
MGSLDQFAKATFALETEVITAGAITWEGPQEVGLTEVRLDGLLTVRDPGRVTGLAPPWKDAGRHADVVVEVKMPGDHLNPLEIRRAELRRAAWHVRRHQREGPDWLGDVGLWHVAPHVPDVLRRLAPLHEVGPGCYAIGHPNAGSLWIAANELPLDVTLLPFLIARSGMKLVEMATWAAGLGRPQWVDDMLRMVRMDAEAVQRIRKQYGLDEPAPEQREWWAFLDELKQNALQKGAERGEQEGRTLEARKALRRVLARRQLAMSAEQEARIDACADLATLERWLDQAVTAASADESLT